MLTKLYTYYPICHKQISCQNNQQDSFTNSGFDQNFVKIWSDDPDGMSQFPYHYYDYFHYNEIRCLYSARHFLNFGVENYAPSNEIGYWWQSHKNRNNIQTQKCRNKHSTHHRHANCDPTRGSCPRRKSQRHYP